MKPPLEIFEHRTVVKWSETYSDKISFNLIHIPNGGQRPKRAASILAKLGVKPGVADFFLSCPNNKYHGLWLELKRQKVKGFYPAKPSVEQIKFLSNQRENGYATYVAYGSELAIKFITKYFYNLVSDEDITYK